MFKLFVILLFTTSTTALNFVPTQIHLALAGNSPTTASPTSMTAAWYTTDQPTTPSFTQYGSQPNHLSLSSTATTTQYLSNHGYHHNALINCSTLPIGQIVYYRVGSGATNTTWSPIFTFATDKWAADASTQVSIFGDLGYEDSTTRRKQIFEIEPEQFTTDEKTTTDNNDNNQKMNRKLGLTRDWSATFTRNAIESLKNRNILDMIFHAGDIGYADDSYLISPFHLTYESIYNGYMNWFQNITSIMPYMVTPGNHESECHSPACVINHKEYGLPLSNFTAFNTRWHMPSKESGGHLNSNMWYSFNFGTVHYVSINSETDFVGAEEATTGDSHMKNLPAGGFGYDGEYMKWLENDLAKADALRKNSSALGRQWLVAVGHRPYSDVVEAAKLFEKYNVDVYFAGHQHSYARSNGGTYGNKTIFVVAGGAGCDEMKQGKEEFVGTTAPADQAVNATSHRYSSGIMTTNTTHLKWELLDSVTGEVLDAFELSK